MNLDLKEVRYVSPKYNQVQAFLEYRRSSGVYELTVYLKMPVHLYDFVSYRPEGKHITFHQDGTTTEGYHEEETGTDVYTHPRGMRIDLEVDDPTLTEDLVDAKIDEFFRECIEEDDGRVVFEKIIGVK